MWFASELGAIKDFHVHLFKNIAELALLIRQNFSTDLVRQVTL